MSLSWRRRLGAIVLVVLILSSLVVPAASAEAPNKNDPSWNAGSADKNDPSWSGAPSAGGMCPVYYRVRKGDNLTIIARKYGVSIWQIQQWNNIWNPDRIYLGQVLVIYRPCPRPQPPPRPPKPPPCYACPPQPCTTCPQPAAVWTATYFNNRDLAGAPVLQQMESRIAYNWGWGSPAPSVPVDNFSARWTTNSNVSGGTYLITVRTDDGARVFIDGNLVLSAWQVQAVGTYQCQVWLSPGWHSFVVEYFEAEGLAEITYNATLLR